MLCSPHRDTSALNVYYVRSRVVIALPRSDESLLPRQLVAQVRTACLHLVDLHILRTFSPVRRFLCREIMLSVREFFVRVNQLALDEMLWQERYSLDEDGLPPFIGRAVASNILVIGKAINFLRRLCGDSEWIMGPMAKV